MTLGTNCLMNINEEEPLAAESKDPPYDTLKMMLQSKY